MVVLATLSRMVDRGCVGQRALRRTRDAAARRAASPRSTGASHRQGRRHARAIRRSCSGSSMNGAGKTRIFARSRMCISATSPTRSAIPHRAKQAPGGLFSLLGLDPLSGLDPAVREIAQSRRAGGAHDLLRAAPAEPSRHAGRAHDRRVCNDAGNHALACQLRSTAQGREATGRFASELPGDVSPGSAKPPSGSSWRPSTVRTPARARS